MQKRDIKLGEKHFRVIDDIEKDLDDNLNFQAQYHEHHEIIFLLECNSQVIVEGQTHDMRENDVIIIPKNKMHYFTHKLCDYYHSYVLFVNTEFFEKNNCMEYETVFKEVATHGAKIPAHVVRTCGLYDAFMKYKKYSELFMEQHDVPILRATIIEILYLVSKHAVSKELSSVNGAITPILCYLSENFLEDTSLDALAKEFSFSKNYLCRIFRRDTGLTVGEYVRKKRLAYARELIKEGKKTEQAAALAGFCDYSAFYRAYKKEYGHLPKEDSKLSK